VSVISCARPLAEAGDAARFGGKAAQLAAARRAGLRVPDGWALGWDEVVALVRQDTHGPDVEAALRASVAGRGPVAVRSSAVGEDSGEATFAGQQETYLWVRGADDVVDAVRDCWASTFSAPAMSYRARMAADRRPEMGVTVQRMVDAAVSGVMFTCNPVSGDPSIVAINASWGLGLGVVGGEVTPDEYLMSKVTGEVVRRNVSAKHIEYRADPSGRGIVCVPVDDVRRSEPCLDEERLAALVDVARRVQKYFGSHQDVEWALGQDGDLFVVQSRPVTATGAAKKPEAAPKPASALSLVMGKFGAGGGS
jgi:pyruvate, water dikinase